MKTVIYPLLARSFRFLRGPVFYFSEKHYLTSVSELDHGTILRYCPADYQTSLQSRFRCVYHKAPDEITDEQVANVARLLAYSLNCFSHADAIDIPLSIVIERRGARQIASFKSDASGRVPSLSSTLTYRLVGGTGAGDIQKVFSLVSTALQNDKRVSIMIDRFNSSLRREKLEDKIIDLSVALEAMLNETTEIMFRLSLYLAFVSQQDRATAYELFRTLYNVRSRIVHGSQHEPRAQRDLESIVQKMPELLRYSKAAMLYYFNYLNQPEPRDWSKHCLNLVLGSDQPIV
jgi:hypothetical protein